MKNIRGRKNTAWLGCIKSKCVCLWNLHTWCLLFLSPPPSEGDCSHHLHGSSCQEFDGIIVPESWVKLLTLWTYSQIIMDKCCYLPWATDTVIFDSSLSHNEKFVVTWIMCNFTKKLEVFVAYVCQSYHLGLPWCSHPLCSQHCVEVLQPPFSFHLCKASVHIMTPNSTFKRSASSMPWMNREVFKLGKAGGDRQIARTAPFPCPPGYPSLLLVLPQASCSQIKNKKETLGLLLSCPSLPSSVNLTSSHNVWCW